jgi:hypothetical protein
MCVACLYMPLILVLRSVGLPVAMLPICMFIVGSSYTALLQTFVVAVVSMGELIL